MERSFFPSFGPRERRWALVHVASLAVSLLVAWAKDGPPPEKAFWAILTYFAEIAIVMLVVLCLDYRASRAGHKDQLPSD